MFPEGKGKKLVTHTTSCIGFWKPTKEDSVKLFLPGARNALVLTSKVAITTIETPRFIAS